MSSSVHATYESPSNQVMAGGYTNDQMFNIPNSPSNLNAQQHHPQPMHQNHPLNSSNYSNAGLSSNINNYQQESDFEDLYNDLESNYNFNQDYNTYMNPSNFNYKKYYEDVVLHKWERVISEENIDDEECRERQASQNMYAPIQQTLSQPNDHHGMMQQHHMG